MEVVILESMDVFSHSLLVAHFSWSFTKTWAYAKVEQSSSINEYFGLYDFCPIQRKGERIEAVFI